jgi:hypothetical protein
VFEHLESNPSDIEKFKDNAALRVIFEYGFIPEKKFVLPDGVPPYKEDTAPAHMSPTHLLAEVKRLYVFCREDLKPIKREQLFINLLESLHPSEAKIVLAVKDQDIPKKFKKITRKLVEDAGFVPPLPKKEKKPKNAVGDSGSEAEAIGC